MSDAIDKLSQSCSDVALELLAQPDFFLRHRDDMPTGQKDLPVERYTGARSNDELVNLRVGALRLLGFSDRAIERECGIDRRTIPHRMAWLEQARRIPAVKDRVLRLVANNAETSSLVLADLLGRASQDISTEMASMIKAVATANGIQIEKLQLLTGAPTEILEQRAGAGRAEIEDFWRRNSIPVESVLVANDSASPATMANAEQNEALPATGHGRDTATSPDDRTAAAGVGASATGPAQATGAGGGAAGGGAGGINDDSTGS